MQSTRWNIYCLVLVLLLVTTMPCLAARELLVCHEQNHPMVSTAQDGTTQGIMVDILEEVARREGWQIRYASCVWKDCLEKLANEEVDLLIGIALTPERVQKYDFNQHTVISNWGLLYARPDVKIETYSDLHGKRVAVVENDVYCNTFIKMMQQFNIRCDLVYADNFRDIFDMIDWGEVDAGVANRFFSLLNERSFEVKPTPILFSPVSVQVAAPKGKNSDVLAAFDRHLEEMKKTRGSVYHQSLKRWLGIEGAGYTVPRWLKIAVFSVLGGILVLSVFVYWLRREVRNRTADLRHEVVERRKSEEQLRLVLDNMQEIFVQMDLAGSISFMSQGISLLGYTPDQVIGLPFSQLCKTTADFDRLMEQLRRQGSITGYRLSLLRCDGTERIVSVNAQLLRSVDGEPLSMVASGTDVTDHDRMSSLMAQTEKMMMVGGLAAGMAHEINNPLGIITQNVQNIRRRVDAALPVNQEAARALGIDVSQVRLYLDQRGILGFMQQMQDAAERMSRIITNMLKFSRKSESRTESADIRQVIEQAIELAASDYDLNKHYDFSRIEIVRDYQTDLPKVPLTVLEIEQVLLNLLKNAAQALAVSPLERVHCITVRTRLDGDWAVIDVEDNGLGMPREVQSRIFDPFYTTKEVGIGTGLGLSVSYAIITNNHHGRLEVRSVEGSGTCFSIRLPRDVQPHRHAKGVQP